MITEDDLKAIAKDGADLTGIVAKLNDYVDMSGVTKENLVETLRKYPSAISAYDSVNRTNIETGVDNFKGKGMIDLIKIETDAVRAEVNPKETPDQKKIRELEEKINKGEKKEELSLFKDSLSISSKEIDKDFPDDIARDLALMGDGAEALIRKISAWHNGILGEVRKGTFNQTPPKSGVLNALSTYSNAELNQAALDFPDQKNMILEEVRKRIMPK